MGSSFNVTLKMVWKPSVYDLKHNVPFRVFLAESLGMTIFVYISIATRVQVISGFYLYALKDFVWQFGDMSTAAIGNGLGLALALTVCARVSGYHLNPAVTLASAVFGRTPWRLVPVYFAAQVVGSFVASTVAFSVHVDNVARFDKREPFVTDAAFISYPASKNASTLLLVWDKVWSTSLYSIFVFGFTDPRGRVADSGFLPILVGAGLTLVILTSGINSGAIINPARDICSRIFCYIAQYGTVVWTQGGYFFWIPLVIPFLGALFGALLYQGSVAAFRPKMPPPGPSDKERKVRRILKDVNDMRDYLTSKREEKIAEEEYQQLQKNIERVNVNIPRVKRPPPQAGPRGIEINTSQQ